jgi:hypothetical protein
LLSARGGQGTVMVVEEMARLTGPGLVLRHDPHCVVVATPPQGESEIPRVTTLWVQCWRRQQLLCLQHWRRRQLLWLQFRQWLCWRRRQLRWLQFRQWRRQHAA